MARITRREFLGAAAAALGAGTVAGSLHGAGERVGALPTVRWGKHGISRLLVGHNPQKGQSYTSPALDAEMKEWYRTSTGHDVELLRRCREEGIDTCQMGAPPMEDALRRFYASGGRMQWISTFYSRPGKGAVDELKHILTMEPRPIGIQQWGDVSDPLLAEGKLDSVVENLKLLRDAGVLVGLGAHDPRVIERAEEKGWDVDFYQCCFYQHRHEGPWREEERERMTEVIRKASKPCIGFKVLGGNRHTKTPEDVRAALEYAFRRMKPTDVVLVGMWQKHRDQVGEDVAIVRSLTAVPLAGPDAEPGFVSLFDGATLTGWTVDCLPKDRELAAKVWTVDRGTILADTVGKREHFYILLATAKEYGDFVLRLCFQLERNVTGNSGIQIRSRYVPETGWMEGPQIDIDPPNPRGTTAKLWNEGPGEHRWLSNAPNVALKLIYVDEGAGWNDLEIEARGMRIRSVLNGVTAVDYDGSGVLDDELHRKRGVGTKGVIALQVHANDELRLRFKDIRIREL